MAKAFACPNCTGRLEVSGVEASVSCPYCGSTVVVPETLREAQQDSAAVTEAQLARAGRVVVATSAAGAGCSLLGIVMTVLVSLGVAAAVLVALRASSPADRPGALDNLPAVAGTPLPPTPTPYARLVQSFGQAGEGPGYFSDARSIAVDREGRVFVGDYIPPRIQAFDPQGTLLWQQIPPGENEYIHGLVADLQGTLYVLAGRTVQTFRADSGEPLATWPLDDVSAPWFDAITLTPQGEILLASDDELVKLDRAGNMLLQIGDRQRTFFAGLGIRTPATRVSGIAVEGTGTLLVATNEDFILRLDREGALLDRLPAVEVDQDLRALAVDGTGRIAWGFPFQILITDPDGRPLGTFETGFLSDLEFDLKGRLVGISRNPEPRVEIYEMAP